ncbi:MAG: UDP-N-acetylmuramoyl-L-alanine--D-glutamate ligase [Gammaproteobacteria bacterium]|nr:UDP-N-acetylmuramoyl-L-alanine--D-glutamate ligase [Gammaproteobacteria bacterium]
MMQSTHKVIVGLGKTGYSCARYFRAKKIPFEIVDNSDKPPYLQQLKEEMPDIKVSAGTEWHIDPRVVHELVVSPGVPLKTKEIVSAKKEGVSITGDIDIFSHAAAAPIIAITGSNGKSTVTTLVGEMAMRAGLRVGIGGNLGIPALDLLDEQAELYVLELSSFQLETTHNLSAQVATILNISADHLDRYASEEDYRRAKERIFRGCSRVVINRADTHWREGIDTDVWSFGEDEPATEKQAGLSWTDGTPFLMCGSERLLPASDLQTRGKHNFINALASIAIARAAEIPMAAIVESLRVFKGLPFRCEWVANINDVNVYNDSKATNVGATNAAVCGLGTGLKGKILLIAGGEGKGADFTQLKKSVSKYATAAILYGRDSKLIESAISDVVEVVRCNNLSAAFSQAMTIASRGDVVLFSPACASFDMFDDYMHRGEAFTSVVKEYVVGEGEGQL